MSARNGVAMDYASVRVNMVRCQIKHNQVTDPLVLSAMAELPRETFVPNTMADIAYVDEAVRIAQGRYLMAPLVLARLIQAAEIRPNDVVLDIGCGTGYASAVLDRLASAVVALESDGALAAKAIATLAELEIGTVAVVEGPLEKGYPRQAPYDVIFFSGGVSAVPAEISDQLAEGGRMVTVVGGNGSTNSLGKGTLFTRRGGIVASRDIFDAATPALPGFAPLSAFTF
ncbi:MAG: protein-L-isoaspartate O-methyltransferase [Rhodospirillales bacterium]|jgi:protein-L-isoaspartate(D-aspartate) O-methyltransferase|nr:protein-L-isoaspartate O-methyltransferase [Rhodospirillales bacterium]MDP7216164.1 protein-L-isoaspartate O-methyltransferase [Rhodospirillales bacterium]